MLKLDVIYQIMNSKNKKVIRLMKDELGRKIMTKLNGPSKNLQLLNR